MSVSLQAALAKCEIKKNREQNTMLFEIDFDNKFHKIGARLGKLPMWPFPRLRFSRYMSCLIVELANV